MIERILAASLRHRWIVLGAAAALMVIGSWRALEMPIDIFPDLTAPRVTVVTEVTGMASEEVETLVTFPIEAAVNGAPGVRRVRSASAPGISIVWVEFDWDTTDTVARQRVTERLQSMSAALPPEASAPTLAPPSSVMGEIVFVALTSDEVDPMELRRTAQVDVRRRLLAVEGVANVVVLGGLEREYQVVLDPHALERFRLGPSDVVEALRAGSQNAPGGYVVTHGQESVVRVLGRARDARDIGDVVVAMRGETAVRVEHLGEVSLGAAVRRGAGSYRGRPAIVMNVAKQPGADTVATTERVDRELDALEDELAAQGIALHRDLFRQMDFISVAIDNLLEVLRDGALLVIAVLLVFLWSLRPTLISALAIPLSLLAAVLVLDALGMTLDTMTLGGLAIAIGELVDDAIVDVENVVRRLRERAALPETEREPVLSTVFRASVEVRTAIVSATVVLVLVFMPLLFLEGLEGRLLRPLAIAYLVAIGASLLVAITVTPALCLLLLPRTVTRRGASEPPFMRWLVRSYEPVLRVVLARPVGVVVLAVALLVVGAAGFLGVGHAFLPPWNEGGLTIELQTQPGTSLDQSDQLASMAEHALLEDPAVVSTSRRTGRAERDEHVMGVESSEIEVRLRRDDPRDRAELLADIRARLGTVPGIQYDVGQPISHRIAHMISGQRSSIAIKVVGDDLDVLRRSAERVREAIADVPGIVDLRVEQVVDIPQIVVRIDAGAAALYGLSAGAAAEAVGTALWGTVAGHVYEEGLATEIRVRYSDATRADIEAVSRTLIPTPSGALVPVSSFAEVRHDLGPNYVLRENVQRRVVVSANAGDRDLGSVVDDIERSVREEVDLPEDVHVEYAGELESERSALAQLLLLGGLAILGIALVVGSTLRSARRALIVLVNLPLALVGGILGVYVSGGVLSIASVIGFITLFGIATRNGILLATRARDLELGGGLLREEAVARASSERLAPILMTAVTAALGLLPLALAMGEPGSEIQAPMAVVILCGLVTSTTLNMIVVPPMLARWGGRSHA